MVNISSNQDSVIIQSEGTKAVFPKGKLLVFASEGESQSVNIRLMGSRKNLYSFLYSECNLAGGDAVATVDAIAQIL